MENFFDSRISQILWLFQLNRNESIDKKFDKSVSTFI